MHSLFTDSLRRDDLRPASSPSRKLTMRQRYLIAWTAPDNPDLQVSKRHYPLKQARKLAKAMDRRQSVSWTGLDSFRVYM